MRTRVFQLAEALYQSIRMQLSVTFYKAIGMGRGATLDFVDVPLNDRVWLADEFARIRALPAEANALRRSTGSCAGPTPAPAGFTTISVVRGISLGSPRRRSGRTPARITPGMTGFGWNPSWRLSWMTHAEAFYDGVLEMRYDGLDPSAQYTVRVVYAGDMYSQTPTSA